MSENKKLRNSVQIYLEKLLDRRPDLKTSVAFKAIEFDEVEIDHEIFKKVQISGECNERVINWEMRCQINLIFVIDSFRTSDLRKFIALEKKGDEIGDNEVLEEVNGLNYGKN